MEFSSRIVNVHLDEEFRPLEELLADSKVDYLNFIRVLKLCWELVDQKSEEKNTEEFQKNCENELKKFLCKQYYTSMFGFEGTKLMDNLYAGPNGKKILFPERCACHYATLRSLLRSAHYGEDDPNGDRRLEWAYYDFTLLFCPFMNSVAEDISRGTYLEKGKINPSTHKNIIVDLWKLKKDSWRVIETILNNNYWDKNKIQRLHDLFLRTIQNPQILAVLYKDGQYVRKWIEYLLGEFVKCVGTKRYDYHWKRLYSGAYMDSNKVEKIKRSDRKLDTTNCRSTSIMVQFMYSVLWRTIKQMNSANFEIFSLSANPIIDLYKYCPVDKEWSTKSKNLSVWGEKIRNFTFYPSGKIVGEDANHQETNQFSNVRTFHLVYAPVNAIWENNRPQDAISFYQFISEWVIKVIERDEKLNKYSVEDLLRNYEFSFEIYSEELRKDKDLLVELKEFASGANLVGTDRTSKINWQNILYNSWNAKIKEGLLLQTFVGEDQEVVSSSVCFCEDDAIHIRRDADIPDNLNPKKSYIVDFTHDEFIAFLMDIAFWKEKSNSRQYHLDIKKQMEELKIVFIDHGFLSKTKRQKIDLKVKELTRERTIAVFPITINRRSNSWQLTPKDEERVREAVIDALWEEWNSLAQKEESNKKFEFIRLIMENSASNGQGKFRDPQGDIYKFESCDSEIALLKRLVFR